MINCLHSDKQTLALVLEDWHRVDNTETTHALAYLLENCCHHLHLIVTSRTHTGLPLSTLRVQGELVEVDSSLIGGVRVTVGDEVLDTSVRARLASMQTALTA